jgi:hypothetical protein
MTENSSQDSFGLLIIRKKVKKQKILKSRVNPLPCGVGPIGPTLF